MAAGGQRLNTEQLRIMALNASALIAAAAAPEYQYYVKVREELRQPVPSAVSSTRESDSTEPGVGVTGPAIPVGEAAETPGAGAAAVAVLAPVLAGTAAAIFLLVGYISKLVDSKSAFARAMLTGGWVFGAVAVVAILVGAVGLLLTALRNTRSFDAGLYGDSSGEVARAREAWHEALLERGILPFLQFALGDPAAASDLPRAPSPAPTSRMPHIGYDRPGFSSPDHGSPPGPRPSFSSPDYTSPDFGDPEH